MNGLLLPALRNAREATNSLGITEIEAINSPLLAGRFRETRLTRFMRATFRTLSRVSPTLTAHIGYQMLARPPRFAERTAQAQLRRKATRVPLNSAGRNLIIYEWGGWANNAEYESNPRKTILMVHGWGARATQMGRIISPLVDAGFRVVSFDAPAHGESGGKTTDLVAFAAAVSAAANYAGTIHTIISHSFGAAMAMLAVRDWGVLADRHILISSFNDCRWFVNAFRQYIGISPQVLKRMCDMMVERNNGRISWENLSVTEMLRNANRPALLIHDEEDAEIPFQHSVSILRGAPNADLLVTTGLGHHRLLRSPIVINRIIDFVSAEDPVKTYAVPTTRVCQNN